ncbi:MAG: DNA internalization-related competence protein ComEC/Rec2 [Deltaproteobacteria bacterium]|nr:DNA internalization-related competence protein ComEC/Rec2 [Deltaproteobacteria bacterium]
MTSQWPFLIPFVSMAAGLTLSSLSGRFCPLSVIAGAFVCLILAALQRDKHIFPVCTAAFFFLWGLYALSPWLIPDPSPASIGKRASDTPLTLEGLVASRPSVSPDGSSVVVRTENIISNNRFESVQGQLMLYVSEGDITVARGDRIRLTTRISVPRRLGLPGEFDFRQYLAFQEVAAVGRVASQGDIVLIRAAAEESWQRSIDLAARRLGDSIRLALKDEKVSSVLAALLIGDQKRIPRELADAYTRAGVNHILSISGFHVGIIAVFITLAALWLFTRSEYLTLRCNVRRLVVLLAVPAMLMYLFLTGNAPATARSVIMLAAFAFALYAERESAPVNTLLLAAFFLIAINPPTLFDISFQLSFLSLWGIVIAVPALTERMSAVTSVCGRSMVQFIAASVAASLATLIPVLFTFKVASLNGILSNFLIVPLLGYGAVLAGFCVLPLLVLLPSCSQILLWPPAKLIELSNWIITGFAALPVIRFHAVTKWDVLFFLLFMTGMTFVSGMKKRLALAAVLPLVALSLHMQPLLPADGKLHVTMLSVGQAEALLLRLPDGKTMLVDGGGYLHDTGRDFGQRILAPALGALGVGRIDWIFSTHDHPDHIGGLAYLTRYFEVGGFWATPAGLSADYSREVRAALAERHIPLHRLAAGDSIPLSGGVALQVLSPGRTDTGHFEKDEMDANEESLVFRLVFGTFSMLFAADAGIAAEHQMLANGLELKSTVLKVGHHGSRFSTSGEFLERVKPEVALISAGAANRFGLPSMQTVQQLAAGNIQLYRTDRDGTIELVSDGVGWSIATPYKVE